MKTLTNLTAICTETDYAEPGVHHHQIGVELGQGAFRALRLGPLGLTILNGKSQVAIPIEALVALAEPHLSGHKPSDVSPRL